MTTELDPQRLRVAAHELGHYLAWQAADLDIQRIYVAGTGVEAHGKVRIRRQKVRDPEQARAYLVGMLAGREADIRWCEHNDLEWHEHTSNGDMKAYRSLHRRIDWVRDVTDREFRAEAHRFIVANWSKITRLAPKLAERGRL